MWPFATDGIAWSVCVCQFFGHVCELCKNGWTDRDADWRVDSGGPKEPIIRWGSDPQEEGAILGGCLTHRKALQITDSVYAETENK